ncbi:MAG TPA: TatD family hydrolase [Candidatus Binatia bacterium]|nr:TatD family hydrolase [Candidatus Binatia bacterium]
MGVEDPSGFSAAGLHLVDTHIHLEEVEGGAEAAMAEARAAGVTDVVAMGVDGETSRQVVSWSASIPGVWAAVGHHPLNQEGPDVGLLRELAANPRVVAIGEVGLDHEDEHRGPHDAQERWFAACCELACELDLPVCVHVRGTAQDVLDALRRHPGVRGVMHYWTLEWEWAERFLELGFHISFSGVITRATREGVREVARRVPADRLLLETDAPWGTPRRRSGSMRPAWMVDTARTVAEVRGCSVEELDALQRANVERLFTRMAGP